jgi:hypothetical protein
VEQVVLAAAVRQPETVVECWEHMVAQELRVKAMMVVVLETVVLDIQVGAAAAQVWWVKMHQVVQLQAMVE